MDIYNFNGKEDLSKLLSVHLPQEFYDRFAKDKSFRLNAIAFLKLTSDYFFCLIEFCQLEGKTPAKLRTLCGFTSALCSFYKIYCKAVQG